MQQNYKYRIVVQEMDTQETRISVSDEVFTSFTTAKLGAVTLATQTSIRDRFFIQRIDTGEIVALFFGTVVDESEIQEGGYDRSTVLH